MKLLDSVLRISSDSILVVESLWRQSEIGDDESLIVSRPSAVEANDLGLDDDAAKRSLPALGRISGLTEECFALARYLRALSRFGHEGFRSRSQNRIARHADQILDTVILQKREHRWSGETSIEPNPNFGCRES